MSGINTQGIYSGWKNLAGSFICAAIAIGFTTYIYGMFTVPVTEAFGISRASFNNGMIAFMAGNAVMSPMIGHLLDRYSARRMLLAGGIVYGLSLIVLSRLDSLWLILFFLGVTLPFATSSCGLLSANTVAVRWFSRRRGRALGILAISTSAGGLSVQPLTAFLIESFGWRDALLILGCIAFITFIVMAIFVVKDRPTGSEKGYKEEFGDSLNTEGQGQPEHNRQHKVWKKGELFRSANFWVLAICIGIMFGIDQAVLVSQVSYFQDIGLELSAAAILVSVKTLSAIVGKLAIGYFADKIDLRYLFVHVAGCNALLMIIYISQPSFWVLVMAVGLLGVAVGGIFPVWATLMAWLFGARSYGTVMGFMSIIMQPFAIVTLRFIGEVYDKTGSYSYGFATFLALALVCCALIWLIKPEKMIEPKLP